MVFKFYSDVAVDLYKCYFAIVEYCRCKFLPSLKRQRFSFFKVSLHLNKLGGLSYKKMFVWIELDDVRGLK